MKKTILFISLFLLIVSVKAQEKIIFGVKGGINLSNITSEYYVENNGKTGFHLGVFTEIPMNNKFSIQAEILYATYGANVKITTIGTGPLETEYSLNYVQVPLLGKIHISQKVSVEIGPSFNFLTFDEEYRPGQHDVFDVDGSFIGNYSYVNPFGRKFELSGVVGISYKLSDSLIGGLRFTKGLTNVFNKSNSVAKSKNQAVQIGIGYLF